MSRDPILNQLLSALRKPWVEGKFLKIAGGKPSWGDAPGSPIQCRIGWYSTGGPTLPFDMTGGNLYPYYAEKRDDPDGHFSLTSASFTPGVSGHYYGVECHVGGLYLVQIRGLADITFYPTLIDRVFFQPTIRFENYDPDQNWGIENGINTENMTWRHYSDDSTLAVVNLNMLFNAMCPVPAGGKIYPYIYSRGRPTGGGSEVSPVSATFQTLNYDVANGSEMIVTRVGDSDAVMFE